MKKVVLALALGSFPLFGQVYTPPREESSSPEPSRNETSSDGSKSESKSPYGEEIPLLDPSAETITVGGVTIPLGDSRLMKARFEKYLNQPPEDSEAAQQYRDDIEEILETLSPLRHAALTGQLGGPSLSEAFKVLPRAASYPGDARLCASLAEAVYTAMLARNDSKNLRRINEDLERERNRVVGDADFKAYTDKSVRIREQAKKVGESETTERTTPGKGIDSLAYANYLKRITEIEALKKANVVRSEAALLNSKSQFQVAMIQWFVQRRFQHVLMATRFYNQIWRDGDATLNIKEGSDVSKLFAESLGTTPTVSTLDSLSSEAIRDAEKSIGAFDYLVEQGELHNASQRLMEAFALGEYLTPVATLPLAKKRLVQAYVKELHLLYDAMKSRDYTRAQELVVSLKSQARDFPAAKADAAIAAYTMASNLAVEESKAFLLAKENERAKESYAQAAELWPTNPKLREFSALMEQGSELVTARNSFDRLLDEKNFREIARRAEEGEFILAVRGDEERTNALRQIRDNLKLIEVAISKAEEFSKVGNNYAAYEQLAKIRQDFPDDPKLGREIELLAPRVADFTMALDKASKLETRNEPQIASALAHYLQARAIYQNSEIAEAKIEELLGKILP